MPLVRLETSERLAPQDKARLCADLSRACSEIIGKPELYVMVAIHDQVSMLHAGKSGPAAFVDVRSIGGLGPDVNRALSARLCEAVGAGAHVPSERIYLNFTEVGASAWGHDGETFGG